ncbi:MAG: signal peptidase II [Myxococcota bacterium]
MTEPAAKASTPASPAAESASPAVAPAAPVDPAHKKLVTKKWVRFLSVFALWLAADLVTKDWADSNLANPGHPQPLIIAADEVGKPLGEVVKARFGWSDDEVQRDLAAKVDRLAPAGPYAGDSKPFNKDGPAQGVSGFYVFWRGDPERAPRRFDRADQNKLSFWLGLAFPKADKAQVNKVAYEAVMDETFATWLPQLFKKLSAEDVAQLAADRRIHPIDPPGADRGPVSPTEVVQAGQDYLLVDHQISVMGNWWKLLYAENPGAAFGFLKGVSPDVRQLLFMLLTVVAFFVIAMIVRRLPPTGWLVVTAFGGILAGAAGNFIDRIRFGYVIDFIDMDFGAFHWPTYNVADIAISLGVVALVLDLTFNKDSLLVSAKDKEKRAKKQAAARA